MIFKNSCTEIILKEFPEFAGSTTWKEHLAFWGNEGAGFGNDMEAFADFVTDEVLNTKSPAVAPEKNFLLLKCC